MSEQHSPGHPHPHAASDSGSASDDFRPVDVAAAAGNPAVSAANGASHETADGPRITAADIAASAEPPPATADSARFAAESGIDEAVFERLMKNRKRRSNHIGLFGPMGVGKTTYLACLYLALDAKGFLNHELTDADTNAFLGWFVQNLQRGRLLPSTQQSWEIQVGVTRNGKNQRVRLRDIPGGWFTEESAWNAGVRAIEHQLRQCTGSMFFIDTDMLLSTSPDAPERRYLNRVIDRAIRRTQRSLRARLTGIRKPVAICFTKSDRLTREHAPDVITSDDPDVQRRQKADYLWSLLGRFDTVFHEGGYEHARYFAVSALGGISGDTTAPAPPEKIEPRGVLDPFFFLLDASKSVAKKQRRRVAALVTFLILATLGTLAGLGIGFHQQTALPQYRQIVGTLDDTTQPLDDRLHAADHYLSEWETAWRQIAALNLIADEVADVRARREAIWHELAEERFKNLKARVDTLLEADSSEAAVRPTERYGELIGDARAFAAEFPHQHADEIRAMVKALEVRYDKRVRDQTDAQRWQEFQQQLAAAGDARARLDVIAQYVSTLPGDRYREQADKLRGAEIMALRTRIERDLGALIAEEERQLLADLQADGTAFSLPQLAEKLRVAMTRVRVQLEKWRLEFEPAAPEMGEFFIATRRDLQHRFADRELDLTLARFDAENWPAKQRAEALLDYLMRHPDAPRKALVEQRLRELRQREVERGFAELALGANAVASREQLIGYLERLRDYRDSHPGFEPSPSFDELEKRAKISWPRNTVTPLVEESRTAAVWNSATLAGDYVRRLETAALPFASETMPEIVEIVSQAKSRAQQLSVRAADLDYRDVRRQYLALFSPTLTFAEGRRQLDAVVQGVQTFIERHNATLTDAGRAVVEKLRAFTEWIRVPQEFAVTIANADFAEGVIAYNAYIRFDWTRNGTDWACIAETPKIKEDYPVWNHKFVMFWQAFDLVHVKAHYDGTFSSGVFFAHTKTGFLSLLDFTNVQLGNEHEGGNKTYWLRIEMQWPAGAPEPIRALPEHLPQ